MKVMDFCHIMCLFSIIDNVQSFDDTILSGKTFYLIAFL